MTHIIIFNIALLGACLYALWGGGAPERATALVFAAAAIATYLRPNGHLDSVQFVLLSIDVVTLCLLVGIALVANRFWPMYVAACQLLTVAIHGVKAYQPGLVFWMYIGANGKLAYPTLILLAIGVARHRQRTATFGFDRGWTGSKREVSSA